MVLPSPSAAILPPLPLTDRGQPRLVAIEIKVGGLPLERAAAFIAAQTGAAPRLTARYEYAIDGDPVGPWHVSLDFALLKTIARRAREAAETDVARPGALIEDRVEYLLRLVAKAIVPVGILSPPLPMERIDGIEPLIERMRTEGLAPTAVAPVFAFGMQLNIEPPSLETATLLSYLKAFLCLHDWLCYRTARNALAVPTLFADPFPRDYMRATIAPDYRPNQQRLIGDYLASNPTRHRALDLLPLLAHLDARRLDAALRDERVPASPTLRYNLPERDIEQPGWGLRSAWRDWLEVERLAASQRRLAALCRIFAEVLDQPGDSARSHWPRTVDAWLSEHETR